LEPCEGWVMESSMPNGGTSQTTDQSTPCPNESNDRSRQVSSARASPRQSTYLSNSVHPRAIDRPSRSFSSLVKRQAGPFRFDPEQLTRPTNPIQFGPMQPTCLIRSSQSGANDRPGQTIFSLVKRQAKSFLFSSGLVQARAIDRPSLSLSSRSNLLAISGLVKSEQSTCHLRSDQLSLDNQRTEPDRFAPGLSIPPSKSFCFVGC